MLKYEVAFPIKVEGLQHHSIRRLMSNPQGSQRWTQPPTFLGKKKKTSNQTWQTQHSVVFSLGTTQTEVVGS